MFAIVRRNNLERQRFPYHIYFVRNVPVSGTLNSIPLGRMISYARRHVYEQLLDPQFLVTLHMFAATKREREAARRS